MPGGRVELGGGDVRRQSAALELPAGDDKCVLNQKLVQGRGLTQIALSRARLFCIGNGRRVAQQCV